MKKVIFLLGIFSLATILSAQEMNENKTEIRTVAKTTTLSDTFLSDLRFTM